jgi:protein-S-isoprenylcysteine O-methyltransferase Ste14
VTFAILRWPSSFRVRPWEYRWRALPLFLSQGVAILLNAWLTGTFAMPISSSVGMAAVVLAAIGVWLRVWGTGQISTATMMSMTVSTDRLVTAGIYGLVRNPLYLADLLVFGGYALFLSPLLAAAFFVFHVVRTLRLIAFEESRLSARFGVAYDDYRRRVPKLVPRVAAPPEADVDWLEGLAANAIWAGFAVGFIAVWLARDVWALTPFETAGFVFAAFYFARARRLPRRAVEVGLPNGPGFR